MANPQRCTIFPSAKDLRDGEASIISSNTNQDHLLGEVSDYNNVSRPQKRAWLDLPIKDHKNLKKAQAPFCKNVSPWLKFQKFMAESQAGKTCVAHRFDVPSDVVAIKQYKSSGIDKTSNLIQTSHINIVNLVDSFCESKAIYLVYELMQVSLEQLHSAFALNDADIAFICQETLHGLWYIHRDLSICHTRIDCSNIFLSADGRVKIADIGASLLEQHRGSEQHDIKCIGRIATEILRPRDTDSRAHSLPNTRIHVRQFIEETKRKGVTIQVLLQHVFLSQASTVGALVAPIMKAKPFIFHDYE